MLEGFPHRLLGTPMWWDFVAPVRREPGPRKMLLPIDDWFFAVHVQPLPMVILGQDESPGDGTESELASESYPFVPHPRTPPWSPAKEGTDRLPDDAHRCLTVLRTGTRVSVLGETFTKVSTSGRRPSMTLPHQSPTQQEDSSPLREGSVVDVGNAGPERCSCRAFPNAHERVARCRWTGLLAHHQHPDPAARFRRKAKLRY